MRKRLGTVLGAFVLLFAAVFAVDRWDSSQYQSPEWKEYQEFNQLRSQLLDYGFPDYESNKELYKELGSSKEALELYKTWNFNDTEKFTIDVMRRLAEQKSAPSLTGNTVIRFLKRFPGDLLKLPMFYFFAVFLLLWIFFEKKNLKALLSILLVWRMGMPHTRLYTSNGRKWNPKSIQRCDWKRQDLSGRRQHRPDTQIYPGIL